MSVSNAVPKVSHSRKGYKENIDDSHKVVRKSLKAKNKDRGSLQSSEPVWERLSQIKKKKKIHELNIESVAHHLKSPRNRQKDNNSSRSTARRKQLGSPTALRKTKLQQNEVPEKASIQPPTARSNKSVLELYTTRDLYKSACPIEEQNMNFDCEGSLDSVQTFFDCDQKDSFFRTQFPDYETFDLSSELDDFKTCVNFTELLKDFEITTPDIPLAEEDTLNCSAKILSNFRDLLEQHEASNILLEPNDVIALKDIIKADERHRQIRKDDFAMLKEILKSQLNEIYHQEKIIKMALEKLRLSNRKTEVTTIKANAAEQPLEQETIGDFCGTSNVEHNPEVDIIFRNVPTLEKEIEILKSLGEKLEATLKRTVSDRDLPKKEMGTMRFEYYAKYENLPAIEVLPLGVRLVSGTAQEFDIRQQSINELKREKDLFFLPMNTDKFELKPTTFEKIVESPEILMQSLSAASPSVALNVIEQDPIFFNNFLVRWSKQWHAEIASKHHIYIPSESKFKIKGNFGKFWIRGSKCGAGGDHVNSVGQIMIKTPIQQILPVDIKSTCDNRKPIKRTRIKLRKRNRREVTQKRKQRVNVCTLPASEDKVVLPVAGNKFLKTLLVGSLQITTFVLMIMAFTYPDLECF